MEVAMGALPRLLPKLVKLLAAEYKLQKEVKGRIKFLQAELESINAALEVISNTPADQLDVQDRIWARAVTDMSYDMEDNIDAFMVQCRGRELLTKQRGFKKFIDKSLDFLARPAIRHKMATNIRDMESRVKEVADRRDRNKVRPAVANPVTAPIDPRLWGRNNNATELVGIDEARDELIKNLIGGDEVVAMQQGKTVSIVGFGGLGKTTVAKAVYEKISAKFECQAFVSVSRTPDMRKLFKDILRGLGKRIKDEMANVEQLIDELREFLQEKRYVIVIDDVWDIQNWKLIRLALPDNNAGYRIITTTRNFEVAKEAGGAYNMKPLSLDNSRKLLYARIFGNEDNCPDEELVVVSDKILKKCAGVPLAVITIASLLAGKGQEKMVWYEVHNSIGTGMGDSLDLMSMRKILSFSYYDMPPYLRPCLLYLSVFPEDYEINTSQLIWMWIGEGFIRQKEIGKCLFKVGESYLNELINRSMVQPVYDENNTLFRCRVHDMVLDLICSLTIEGKFVTILNDMQHTSPSQKDRRLSLQSSNTKTDDATPRATLSMQHVRSVVVFPSAADLMPSLQSFRVLRVLDLQGSYLFTRKKKGSYLSQGSGLKCLGKLFHLRYLGLRDADIAQLPEEIGNLQFLQTLDLRTNLIDSLPSTVVQLRDLMCLRVNQGTRMPDRLGSLTSLEVLSGIRNDDSMHVIEEIGHLTDLRELDITFDDQWNDRLDKSLGQCLCKLRKIEDIDMWTSNGQGNLDGWVTPPHRLRRLLGTNCSFSTLPGWMNLPILRDLSDLHIGLREVKPDDLEILGSLPVLCNLYLAVGRTNLGVHGKFFAVGAGSFPSLASCQMWRGPAPVVFRQGAMPRVQKLIFNFPVREMVDIASSSVDFDLGLGNLPSLLDVSVVFDSKRASEVEAMEAAAALRHATEIHPNHPFLSFYD